MPKPNNSRRQFLQGCSYAIASMAGARLTNLSFAQDNNPSDTLVVVFLRGGWDALVLVYFVCCGVSRLARYNVTAESLSAGADKVAYFEGTPIPSSILITGVLAAIAAANGLGASLPGGVWTIGPGQLHPLVAVFALSGTLMISKTLRIPKF